MNLAVKRKVSPRAPTLSLDEAIGRVEKMYKQEGRHAAPVEVAMKHIGYSSKNGAALQTVASLGYWGLIERPGDGLVVVAKAFEDYLFTPLDSHRRQLLIGFLKKPALFASLLDKYQDRLPSDGSIKYDLIQRGFIPASAVNCLNVFKKSVEFARYFERGVTESGETERAAEGGEDLSGEDATAVPVVEPGMRNAAGGIEPPPPIGNSELEFDRIPVRLAGGRRAWLEIPMPFFSADKVRLKNHIDLLLTDDEDV
jgi:hypothetical protein